MCDMSFILFEINIIHYPIHNTSRFPLRFAGPAHLSSKCALPALPCPAHQYPSALAPAPACLWKKLQRLFSGATQRRAECGKSAALHQTTHSHAGKHSLTQTRALWSAAVGGSTASGSGTSWFRAEEPRARRRMSRSDPGLR